MYRRPMMYLTSLFAAALILTHYLGVSAAFIVTGAIVVFLFCFYNSKNSRKAIILFTVIMISGIIGYAYHNSENTELSGILNGSSVVLCSVCQVNIKETVMPDGTKEEYLQLVVRTEKIIENKTSKSKNVKKDKALIRKYNDYPKLFPGDSIVVSGDFEKPMAKCNPGCFDYSAYLKSLGIKYIVEADDIFLNENGETFSAVKNIYLLFNKRLSMVKEQFLFQLGKHADEESAGVVRAIIFGDKSGLDEDVLEDFRKNGTAHILAVSGLHIGIIYGFISFLWRWRKGMVFFIIIIFLFFAYMVMTAFSLSVVRAVIMIWLHAFARLTNRRYDMMSAAYFAALTMLLYEPMYLLNVSFQMSFIAVLTLGLLLPIIKQVYSGVFMVGIAIQAGLTPYTLYMFNYFSPIALLVNIPIVFLTGIIVPAGMCCMILGTMFEQSISIISKSVAGMCIILKKINSMTCIDGVTTFDICSPDLWVVIAYYLVLFLIASEEGRLLFLKRKKQAILFSMAAILFISVSFGCVAGQNVKNSDLVFVDVGQGDCIHFKPDRKSDYLIDGGGNVTYDVGTKTLKPYLLKNGCRTVDGAFVTHLHTDHYKGISELCRDGMVERLYVYEGYRLKEQQILKDTGLERTQITYLYSGQKVVLNNNTEVRILWPERCSAAEYEDMNEDEADENRMSLILKVSLKGKEVLITGDVDSKCLDELAAKYGEALKSDILKVAHHGSKYSDSADLLKAVDPEHAVIQVGKNNFGHPDKGIVENLRRKGIMIYRNDTDGAVSFFFRKNGETDVTTVRGE